MKYKLKIKKVKKLPSDAMPGEMYELMTKKGIMVFKRTRKKGFGMWRIVKRK